MRINAPLVVELMEKIARLKATEDRTGWARREAVRIAYYPRCNRYAYFLYPRGVINKRDLMDHLEGQA